jgi:fumarylacetoacetate (FAA) hydrolase
MKLASLKDGTRDGKLHVVSRDLARAADASDIAPSLRLALEQWEVFEPALWERFAALQDGVLEGERFETSRAMAPLPRSFQWLDGSVFKTHGALMTKAFNLDPKKHDIDWPMMYQGAGDAFIGPQDDIVLPDPAVGIDFEAEIAVITGEVPMGVSAAEADDTIKLLVLVNDVSQRAFAQRELAVGFGFIQAKPSSSFAPVAVTPDELGTRWRDGRLYLPVRVDFNAAHFGHPDAGEMAFSFPELIAFAATYRPLGAGTIVGSGTVSNAGYAEVGSACIAERRAIEQIDFGAPRTPFMKFGDRVRIEVSGEDGVSVFGKIDQALVQA